MLSFRRLLVVLTCIGYAFADRHRSQEDGMAINWEKFSTLLDTVDDEALHRVLHAIHPKFKDGIFHKDRTAVEQVHSENPMMASRLVHIAKRQTDNSTITSSTSSTTQPPAELPPPTSATTSSSPSVPSSSSDAQASSSQEAAISSALSSALSNELTATSLLPPTTVFIVPSTPTSATPIRTDSQGVVFSSSGGVRTLSSTAVNVRFTPVTSTRTFYTTLSDGMVRTTTTVVVVNGPVTEGSSANPTTSAGLQNGAVKAVNGGLTGLLIGAAGVLVAL